MTFSQNQSVRSTFRMSVQVGVWRFIVIGDCLPCGVNGSHTCCVEQMDLLNSFMLLLYLHQLMDMLWPSKSCSAPIILQAWIMVPDWPCVAMVMVQVAMVMSLLCMTADRDNVYSANKYYRVTSLTLLIL